MSFQTAKREAVPLMVGLAGTSGSGKTYSALLLAAGIAGEGGKVGFIDTEAGRGSMYADDQNIIDALPGGEYLIKRLTEPFTPKKYADAINEAIKGGVTALVIDSASHE
jgi:signal recognition particle GTPase